jgi:Cys-tRNA(Pro)/Cys-tRNA(Cys) deacylase
VKKTNAARLLDSMGIEYETREYEVDESDLSAQTVADKVGLPPDQVFKTLVVSGDKTGVLLAIVPGDAELDVHALARVSGNKRVGIVPLKDVQPITGYIRGGVSPLGVKKRFPVYLDETAILYPFISISAGMRGMQLLVAPDDLIRAIDAQLAGLAVGSNA